MEAASDAELPLGLWELPLAFWVTIYLVWSPARKLQLHARLWTWGDHELHPELRVWVAGRSGLVVPKTLGFKEP